MTSKRFKKLPKNSRDNSPESIEKLLSIVKQNCTTKFDEAIDLSSKLIINKKKMKLI